MVFCAPGDQLQLPSAVQRTVVGSLTRLRPDIFVNRLLRTRMIGGAGRGREKLPLTRLAIHYSLIRSIKVSILSPSMKIKLFFKECLSIPSHIFSTAFSLNFPEIIMANLEILCFVLE